jgi:mono/diheme cytochrome c family protein
MKAIGHVAGRVARAAFRTPFLVLVVAASPAWADKGGGDHAASVAIATGEGIYRGICQGCHMPDARGASGAGRYPALAGDPALASADFVAITLLQGRRNMPAFRAGPDADLFFAPPPLNDEQIAAVVNYVRSHFGNHFKGTISAPRVKALRESLPQR